MAEIKFTIPDNRIQLVLDAMAKHYGYQDLIDGVPNPETKAQFAKRMISEQIKTIVRDYEWQKAQETVVLTTTEIQIT